MACPASLGDRTMARSVVRVGSRRPYLRLGTERFERLRHLAAVPEVILVHRLERLVEMDELDHQFDFGLPVGLGSQVKGGVGSIT